MKLIKAIIQPHRLDAMREAVNALGIAGLTVYEAKGYGRQRGHTEVYRGAEYEIAFRPKNVVELVVEDGRVEDVINAIIGATKTGKIGDGKIFVSTVEEAIRIRTSERNDSAL